MDFDNLLRPMAPVPTGDYGAPLDNDGDETGAGSDFWIWSPTIGPADSSVPSTPNPMDISNPGFDAGVSLASRLHWRPVSAKAHPQKWLCYRGRLVPIDINIAPLVEAMWQAGFITLACCEGDDTDTQSAYVMFSEEIGKRFMEWAQAREKHLPEALTRRFELLLQDDEWHPYMADRYPLLQPVEPDVEGRLFTLCWRFHRQELLDHRDLLVRLLRAGSHP
jgi:hypothetical protein